MTLLWTKKKKKDNQGPEAYVQISDFYVHIICGIFATVTVLWGSRPTGALMYLKTKTLNSVIISVVFFSWVMFWILYSFLNLQN